MFDLINYFRMKELFESVSVTVSAAWLKYFPQFVPDRQNPDGRPEVTMCTSSEVASMVNTRLSNTNIYIVYPDHSWIDVRYVAELYLFPLWEPTNMEEFSRMISLAWSVAEKYQISIILLTPTDFSIQLLMESSLPSPAVIDHFMAHISLPENFALLDPIQKIRVLEEFAGSSPFNLHLHGEDKTLGIVADAGIAKMLEQFSQLQYPVLKIGHYPLGRSLVEPIYYSCDEILVLENGLPYIEQRLRGIMGVGTRIRGKLNRIVPSNWEISLQDISTILNL